MTDLDQHLFNMRQSCSAEVAITKMRDSMTVVTAQDVATYCLTVEPKTARRILKELNKDPENTQAFNRELSMKLPSGEDKWKALFDHVKMGADLSGTIRF